ncbi:MAG: hypothetical protein V4565_06000 [Bacteroidota bacterium]
MKQLTRLTALLFISGLAFMMNGQTKNSISFSSKPFTGATTHKTVFKAGDNIYARVLLEKTLQNFALELDAWGLQNVREDGLEGKYTHCIVFEIKDQNTGKEDQIPHEILVYLSANDLTKNQLDIDISPDEEQASMYFYGPRGTFFNRFSSLQDEDDYIGKVINFQLVLNEYKKDDKYRYDKGLTAVKVEGNSTPGYTKDTFTKITSKSIPSGFITIDYTESTKETQRNWYNEQAAILDATREKIINDHKK